MHLFTNKVITGQIKGKFYGKLALIWTHASVRAFSVITMIVPFYQSCIEEDDKNVISHHLYNFPFVWYFK